MPSGENGSDILHSCAHPWLQAPDNVRCDAAVFIAAKEGILAGAELTIDYEGSCRIQVLPHITYPHSAGLALAAGRRFKVLHQLHDGRALALCMPVLNNVLV
jgi:hypothetical protein